MKCKKCGNEMQIVDFGEDFEYLICKGKNCYMTLTIQNKVEALWEDKE